MRVKQIQMLLRLTLSSHCFYFLPTHNCKKYDKKWIKNWEKKKKKMWQLAGSTVLPEQLASPLVSRTGGHRILLRMANLLCFRSFVCMNHSKHKLQWTGVFHAPSTEEWVIGWQHSGPYLVLLQASCSVNKRILLPCATSHFYFHRSSKGERAGAQIMALPVKFNPRIKWETIWRMV